MNLDKNTFHLVYELPSPIQEYLFIILFIIFLIYVAKLICKLKDVYSIYRLIKYRLNQKLLIPILLYIYIQVIFDSLNILHEIYISTREFAILTWIIFFIIIALTLLWKQQKMDSIYSLIKHTFAPKLLIPTLLYFTWFIIGIVLLYKINIWNFNYLVASLTWFLFEALIIFYTLDTFNKAQKLKKQIKSFLWKSISFSALFTLFVNLYTFNYFLELILVLILFVCGVFIALVKNIEKNKILLGCFEKIITLIGLLLLLFSLLEFLLNYELLHLYVILIEYLFLIFLSFWIIPAVYLIRVYAIYENIWITLRFLKYIPKDTKKSLKFAIVKNCHINFSKLEKFQKDKKWRLIQFESNNDIKEYFLGFNEDLK